MPEKKDLKRKIAATLMYENASEDNKALTALQELVKERQKKKLLYKRMYPNTKHSDAED